MSKAATPFMAETPETDPPGYSADSSGILKTETKPNKSLLRFFTWEWKSSGREHNSSQTRLETPRRTTRRVTGTLFFALRLWGFEFGSLILVIISLLANFAVLLPYQDKPLPQWPYGLSINTLLSIFSSIQKAAAGVIIAEGISHSKWTALSGASDGLYKLQIYDDASRGPLGALQLIWTGRWKHLVATLGAFLALTFLVLDPFTQQMIRFSDCTVARTNETASIPIIQRYNRPCQHSSQVYDPYGRESMLNAIRVGLSASETPKVQAHCPTSRCEFRELYTTVGACSYCEEVSSTLNITTTGENNGTESNTYAEFNIPGYLGEETTLSWYSYRNNPRTTPLVMFKDVNTTETMESYEHNSVYSIWANLPDIQEPWLWNVSTATAFKCKIRPCLKILNGTIINGVLSEQVHETIPMPDTGNKFREGIPVPGTEDTGGSEMLIDPLADPEYYDHVLADLNCLNGQQKDILREQGYQFDDVTKWLPYNRTPSNPPFLDQEYSWAPSWQPNNRTPAFPALCEHDSSLLNGSCFYASAPVVPVRGRALDAIFDGGMSRVASVVSMGEWSDQWYYDGDDSIIAIWAATGGNGTLQSLSRVFDRITEAMTTFMRQQGTERVVHYNETTGIPDQFTRDYSSPPATVYANVVCVRVRWIWFTFPAALVLFLTIFFACLVSKTRSEKIQETRHWIESGMRGVDRAVHDFKSSPLTLLFHGFDQASQEAVRAVGAENREGELYRFAKEARVRMVPTEQGWKLALDGTGAGHHPILETD